MLVLFLNLPLWSLEEWSHSGVLAVEGLEVVESGCRCHGDWSSLDRLNAILYSWSTEAVDCSLGIGPDNRLKK